MAQHIPIEKLEQKVFRNIEKSIRAQKYLSTSMRFDDTDDKNIFITRRYIGPGFVWGDTHGMFEVHTNDAQEVLEIYLVA